LPQNELGACQSYTKPDSEQEAAPDGPDGRTYATPVTRCSHD